MVDRNHAADVFEKDKKRIPKMYSNSVKENFRLKACKNIMCS